MNILEFMLSRVQAPFAPDPGVPGRCAGPARPERVTIVTQPQSAMITCPDCGTTSCRVHSYYERLLGDLPWQSRPVLLRVQVRRFRCDNTYQCSSFSLRQGVRSMRPTRPSCRCRIASSAAGVSGIR